MKNRTLFKLSILSILIIPLVVYGATVSRVTTFSDGSILTAGDLNAEFNNIVDNMNALTNDNIATGAAISPSKISSSIKGSGITRNTSTGELSVNVDNSSIDISSDNLRLKDDGITTAKIADEAVTNAKMAVTAVIPAGTVVQFHTFNGTVSVPRGWMILNGDIVNQANYDAIHGAGTYTTDGIASSALLAKNLPDMDARYATGSDTTTQSGASAITAVGNSANAVNIAAHTHEIPFSLGTDAAAGGGSGSLFFNGDAAAASSPVRTTTNQIKIPGITQTTGAPFTRAFDNSNRTKTVSTSTTSQNIRPDSIQFIFIMKVI